MIVHIYANGVYYGAYPSNHGIATVKNMTPGGSQGYAESAMNLRHNAKGGTAYISDVTFYREESKVINNYAINGASMRLGEDAASSGLRFTHAVNNDWFASLGEDAIVGALIMPTDVLEGATFSEELLGELNEGEDYVDIYDIGFFEDAPEATEDVSIYYASLVDIQDTNYARSFTSVGYVEDADGTRYYTGAVTRSIYDVARSYTASGTVPADYEELVAEYMSTVVEIEYDAIMGAAETLKITEIANYTSPYTVDAKSATSFRIAGEGCDGILAVILNGVVYTGGWVATETTLAAALPQ